MRNKRAIAAPKTIWLQIGEDNDPADGPIQWDECTWCVDQINDNDVEYRLMRRSLARTTKDEA